MYECNDRYTLKRSQKFFITNINTLTFWNNKSLWHK